MHKFLTLLASFFIVLSAYSQSTCDYDTLVTNVSCYGSTNGAIELSFPNWECGGGISCASQESLPSDYCSNCIQATGGDVTVNSGQKYCIKSGNYNTITLNPGGEAVICDTGVSINNINFSGGQLTVNADITLNQISINSNATVIKNYKKFTVNYGFTFKGNFYNYGTLNVKQNFNVNAGNHYIENKGIINFSTTFNNKFETVNYGVFNQLDGDFHNNSLGKFTNYCKLNVKSLNSNYFINDSEIHNYGTVDVAEGSRFNGNSKLYSYKSSSFSTSSIVNLDGQVIGDNSECSQLTLTGSGTSINGNASLTGQLYVCGYDLAQAPSGTVGVGVTNSCNCSSSGAGVIVSWQGRSETENVLSNLSAGTYYFSASCGNCNLTDIPVKVNQPEQLIVTLQSVTNESVENQCDGSATISIEGGTEAYSISWPNGDENAETSSGFCDSTYTVSVVDDNSCNASAIFTIEAGNPACDINFNVSSSQAVCQGNTNGYIEFVSGGTGGTTNGGFVGCVASPVPAENYCSSCDQSFNGNYANISSGRACLKTGFNGHVDLNGGTLVVCDDSVRINSINFNGGEIIVLGNGVKLDNINMNNAASRLVNYGSVTSQNITFNGALINHGYFFVDAHLNVNSSTASIHNTGKLVVSNNFVINTTTLNEGLIHVSGEFFIVNGQATLDNRCTIRVGNEENQFGRFINDGATQNSGEINVGYNFRLNSSGSINALSGSVLSTYNIEMFDGQFHGPSTGCTKLEVDGNFGYNSSMFIDGNVSICGFDISTATTGTVATSVNNNCSCEPATVVVNPTDFEGYTFEWINIPGTSSTDYRVDNLSPGTYTVVVTSALCSDTFTVTILEVENSLSSTYAVTEVSGDDACDNQASITVSTGVVPVYYEWYLNGFLYRDGVGQTSFSDLCSGDYKVVLTDGNGCQNSHEFKIGSGNRTCIGYSIELEGSSPSCGLKADGSVSINRTGGKAPFTYDWNTGGTDSLISFAPAQLYIATVTDANNCVFTDSLSLEALTATCPECETSGLEVTAMVNQMPTCNTDPCDGSITISAMGGVSPLRYFLNETAIGVTELTQPVCVGMQHIKVLDANSCFTSIVENTDPGCVTDPCEGVSVDIATTNTLCPEKATGSATVSIVGGASPYRIKWNHGQVFSSLSSVHYYNDLGERRVVVEVIDQNGCELTDVDYVKSTSASCPIGEECLEPITIDFTIIDTPCENQEAGAVVATVGFPYTSPKYYWNDVVSNDLIISQLPAEAYRLRVVDQETGCFAEKTATVNADDDCDICAEFAVTKNSQNEGLCSGAGSVDVSATPGFGPYTIYVNGIVQSGKVEVDNFVITGLLPINNQIKIVSRQGCTAFINVNLAGNGVTPLAIDLVRIKPESCTPGQDGEIIINYFGGIGRLVGHWSDDHSNRPIRIGLEAGDYEFTLSDASGCSITKKYTVPGGNESINVNTVVVDATDGCNGKIYIDELGTQDDLSYAWSNISADVNRNEGLCKGFYTVTITDQTTGCIKSLGIRVKGAPCNEDNVELTVTDETIAGQGGFAAITLEGCDTTVVTTNPNCTPNVIDLSQVCSSTCDRTVSGNQEVNVDNGERVCVALGTELSGQVNVNNGEFVVCGVLTSTSSVNVDQGALLEVNNAINVNNVTINTGGFLVNNGSIQTVTFMVNDSFENNGDINVSDHFTLNSQGSGENNGTLTVGSATLNGTLNLSCGTYNDKSDPIIPICPTTTWNPGGVIGTTSPTLNCIDDNSVTVLFCDGTSKTFPVDIECYEGIGEITGILTNGFCYGEKGSIDVTVSGGTGNYSYAWYDALTNSALNTTSQDIADLDVGSYYVIVTDNGSSETKQSKNFVVVESPLLTVTTVGTPTCKNGKTGTGSALVTGGTGFATYIYAWESLSNNSFVIENANAAEIGKLEKGAYQITITDRNNCMISETVDVDDTNEECSENCDDFYATAKGVGPSCATATNGYAVLSVKGGGGNYYLEEGFTLNGFISGSQSFTVYEEINGEVCSVPVSVIIPVTNKICPRACELDVALFFDNLTCASAEDGGIDLEITGATPEEYSINWAHLFPANLEDEQLLSLENLPSARYEVTVTHKLIPNCAATVDAVLQAPESARIYADNFEVCENDPTTFTSSYAIGNVWSKASGEVLSTDRSVAIGTPGDYVLTIGAGNCTDLVVDFTLTEALNCNDGTKVLCEPYIPPTIDSIPTCEQQLQVQAVYNAQYQYTVYLEEQKKNFQREYMAKCLSAKEKLSTEFEDGEYHYTLYYYDQSGNLTRTIPPAGVVTINDADSLEQIKQDRRNNTTSIFTNHSYKTTYTYNSLNQLIGQNVPDHETMPIFSIDASGFRNGIDPNWNITSMELDNEGNGFITTVDNNGNGYLLNTSDHGKSWSQMSMLGIVTLHDVEIVDANRAVAVGDKGTYVRSDDGGENWIPYPVGTSANFRFVHFTSTDEGIIWSATGANWTTANGGETWSPQSGIAGINGTIRDLRFYDNTIGVLLVQQNGRSHVFETNDGGTNWTGPVLSQNIEVPALSAFHALDAQHIVAVGNNGLVVKTIDGGNQWELIDHNQRLNFTSIHMLNGNSGAALAGNTIYKTTDGGNQWQATTASNINFSEIKENGIAAFIQGNQSVLLSTSAGVSIQKTITGPVDSMLAADVRGIGLNQLLASSATTNQELYISYNQGGRWYNVAPDPLVGNFVDLHQSSENLLLGLTATGKVYRLTNAKAIEIIVTQTGTEPDPLTLDWEEITDFGTIGVSSLQFDDDLIGYAVLTSGALYQTLDGGVNWNFFGSSYSASQQQVVAGQRLALNAGELFSNDGALWDSLKTTLQTDALQGVYSNGTKTIAVGDNSVIVSTSNGITWQLDSKIGAGVNLVSTSLTASGISLAVSSEGKVFQPYIGGYWANRTLDKSNALNEIAILDDTTLYAVGNAATVYPLTTNPTTAATAVDLGGISDDLLAVDIASANYLLSVGEGGKILKYNGTEWKCVTMVEPLALNATDMVDGGNGYGVGNNGTVVKTTDDGQSWQNQNSSQTQRLNAVVAIDLNNVIAVGNGGAIVRTTNGGADNFSAAANSGTTNNLYDLQMVTSSLGYAVGAGGVVLRTTNGGANWSAISSSAITEHLYSVHFVSANYGFVAGASGAVYLYNNGWQLGDDISLAVEESGIQVEKNEKINDIYFVDNLTGYAITEEGNMYKTLNAGTTWEVSDIAGGNNTALNFIYPLNKNNFFVAGKKGELSKVNDETNLFSSKFWYDRLGRLVASQNADQYDEQAFSYSVYDELGRIVEVGELVNTVSINDYTEFSHPSQFRYDAQEAIADKFAEWLGQATLKREVNRTQYDQPSALVSIPNFTQENLRNRVASIFYYEDFSADYQSATHYTYDIHGNVETVIQDFPDLAVLNQQFKRIDYDYDLVSGNVNQVNYQAGKVDQFYHRYTYDSDNRIVLTKTSRDGVIWDTDAKAEYYKHGPLARMEIGHNQVQAMDYNYTIHGWLKGVNATSLQAENDPGKDGLENNFAKDELAYNLNYYKGDYSAINQPNNGTNFLVDVTQSDFETAQVNLYNGNISQMVTGIRQFMQGNTGPQGMNYTYDQLNRLKTARAYTGAMAQTNNTWGTTTVKEDYGVDLSYDPNGNILSLDRKGVASEKLRMDEMDYEYETIANGYAKNTNRLKRVTDDVPNGNYDEDIDTQLAQANYLYDKIGNLVKDKAEGIDTIIWNVQGKVKSITKAAGKGDGLEFRYDAQGNRIVKIVKPEGSTQKDWKYTYYLRDASGNAMAVYEKTYQDLGTSEYKEQLALSDFHLYGSERLGTYTPKADEKLVAERTLSVNNVNSDGTFEEDGGSTLDPQMVMTNYNHHYVGNKNYEGKNHLGNVLVVFSDAKEALDFDNNGIIDAYEAIVVSANDYYPFGSPMPNRKFSGVNYRYGFNGMEKDDEVKGEGNSYTTEFRQLDPRLGRWLTPDPMSAKFPWQSPYVSFDNNPIYIIDPSGLEGEPSSDDDKADGSFVDENGGVANYREGSLVGDDGNIVEGGNISVGDLKDFGYTYKSGGTYGVMAQTGRAVGEAVGEFEANMDNGIKNYLKNYLKLTSDYSWEGQPNGQFGVNNKGGKLLLGTTGLVTSVYTLPAAGIGVLAAKTTSATVYASVVFQLEIIAFADNLGDIKESTGGNSPMTDTFGNTAGALGAAENFVQDVSVKPMTISPATIPAVLSNSFSWFLQFNTGKKQ